MSFSRFSLSSSQNGNRSRRILDDSSKNLSNGNFPQPFVAFHNPRLINGYSRIRCGVPSSNLTESLTGFLSGPCNPTRKRSTTPVLVQRGLCQARSMIASSSSSSKGFVLKSVSARKGDKSATLKVALILYSPGRSS